MVISNPCCVCRVGGACRPGQECRPHPQCLAGPPLPPCWTPLQPSPRCLIAVCLSISFCINLSISVPVYLSLLISVFIYLSISVCLYPFIYLSVCLISDAGFIELFCFNIVFVPLFYYYYSPYFTVAVYFIFPIHVCSLRGSCLGL